MKQKIPIYQPSLSGNEKLYVNECLDDNWISSKGKYVSLFEQQFSEYIGVSYATTVSNGTVALHLALVALGIQAGDEVIVPTLTYIASVNAINYVGATPVFVDSLASTWQIDIEDVKRKITPKTKAVMAVHLYGQPCDMDALSKLCEQHNLFLIEDAAEALGSMYKEKHVGTFGHVSTFSFYGNKTITTGEGGMVVTNDTTLYERLVHFKGQGLAKYRQYWHDVVGYNYRMTNVCAAIGVAQLEQADKFLARKREIAFYYKNGFEGLPIEFHQEAENTVHSYWMCSILVEKPKLRDDLRSYLEENGIETRPTFYPVHTMPMYSSKYEKHVVAENIGWRGINLPSFPSITNEQLDFIIDTIKQFYEKL